MIGASMGRLLDIVFEHGQPYGSIQRVCTFCQAVSANDNLRSVMFTTSDIVYHGLARHGVLHVSDIVDYLLGTHIVGDCGTCNQFNLVESICKFINYPQLLIIEVRPSAVSGELCVTPSVRINGIDYAMCAVAYHGGFHFSARIVTISDQVWAHDGRLNGGHAKVESTDMSSVSFTHMNGMHAHLLIYRRVHEAYDIRTD